MQYPDTIIERKIILLNYTNMCYLVCIPVFINYQKLYLLIIHNNLYILSLFKFNYSYIPQSIRKSNFLNYHKLFKHAYLPWTKRGTRTSAYSFVSPTPCLQHTNICFCMKCIKCFCNCWEKTEKSHSIDCVWAIYTWIHVNKTTPFVTYLLLVWIPLASTTNSVDQ